MKWGTLYSSEYVNKLYNMCKKNISGNFRFVCLTDDSSDLNDEIEIYPCPSVLIPPPKNNVGWRKISLFANSKNLYELNGYWLYLDLDIVITNSIDKFFSYKPDESFIVMRNWNEPNKKIGNTSVYRFLIGSHENLLSDLEKNHEKILDLYPNSQTYISNIIKNIQFWPNEWCSLFKIHCIPKWPLNYFLEPKLPKNNCIVAFPGKPNPHDALKGIWPMRNNKEKWKKIYKYIKPASWISNHWR